MAKKFKTNSGGHVRIWTMWRPEPIDVPAEGTYETEDKREIELLKASSELSEVRSSPKGTPKEPKTENPVRPRYAAARTEAVVRPRE